MAIPISTNMRLKLKLDITKCSTLKLFMNQMFLNKNIVVYLFDFKYNLFRNLMF